MSYKMTYDVWGWRLPVLQPHGLSSFPFGLAAPPPAALQPHRSSPSSGSLSLDSTWQRHLLLLWCGMAHCKGKDNVKKRASRRRKTERLQAAKEVATKSS